MTTASRRICISAPARKSSGRPSRKYSRRFTPDDALRHHEAASLVPWQYRHAWAAIANRTLRAGKSERAAIREANEDLNGRLDRDADFLAGATPGEWRDTWRRVLAENSLTPIFTAPRMPASVERFRRRDFTKSKLDLERHPQLLAEAIRQRQASGRSQ